MTDYTYARAGFFEDRTRVGIVESAVGPMTTTRGRGVDWRRKGVMTPVREQRPCLSCTAFGLMAVLEAHHKGRTGQDIELAAPWVHSCLSGRECGQTFRILQLADALAAVGRIPTAAEVAAAGGDCTVQGSCPVPKLEHLRDAEAIRNHLSAHGPVAAVLSVTPAFFQRWRNDEIYKAVDGFSDNHVMCLTGFDDDGRFWRAKNSLGNGWSDDGGYVRIAYGSCEIGRFKYSAFGAL